MTTCRFTALQWIKLGYPVDRSQYCCTQAVAIVLAMVEVLAAMAAGVLASASLPLLWMCTGCTGHHITWSLHGVPRGGLRSTADFAGAL